MNTNELIFYHGTGAHSARSILTDGSKDKLFEEIGALRLGREILAALLAEAGLSFSEAWRLPQVFETIAAEYSSPWLPALRGLEEPEVASLWGYGAFFVTANIGNAYRYAIGNPYRSEFVHVLAESLKLLASLGHSLPQDVPIRFPQVFSAIANPSPPVVLEIQGISCERLRTERGGINIDSELEFILDTMKYLGVSGPCAFRVSDVRINDVVAVHDLGGWSAEDVGDGGWRPDPLASAAIRLSVRDWLAR